MPQRLTDYEDLYRVLVETSTDLILVTDGLGRISYANRAARELLGYEPEEMVGAGFAAFVAPQFEAEAASVAERAARGRDTSSDGGATARRCS
jgi:PAS domain S-box-containing protein